MSKNYIANAALRMGVAFAFIYAGVDAFFEPNSWLDYFPQFMTHIAPVLTLLHLFGFVELIIAAWILTAYKIFIPSLLAAVMLLAIVFFNLQEFQLLFRDVSIAAAAFALAVSNAPEFFIRTPAR